MSLFVLFFSSRRRHTRCALVTGVQTCALPISAALAPGGWLVVEAFSKAQAGRPEMGPDDPDRLYSLEELQAALPTLQVVEALAGRVLLDEGTRHQDRKSVG